MIDRLKGYAGYAPSRIPWAPTLPAHWRVERGKSLFRKVVRPVRADDEVVTCFRDGTVTLRKNRRTGGFTEAVKEHGYQGIRQGDLVIHAMDAFAGAAGVAECDGKGTPVYSVCVSHRADNSHYYYAHIVREMARQQWILALARGIRERSTDFRFDTFATQDLPVPPPDEQSAIVRFLNHADQRIRRYIRSKQKLIKLLEEKKQVIIQQAVTRGIVPIGRLKSSGVRSLEDVPEHWEVRRLRNVAELRVSNVDKHTREDEIPVRLCNYVDVYKNDYIRPDMSLMHATATLDEVERFRLAVGDVLITKDSESWTDIGVPALVIESADDLVSGYHLALLRPFEECVIGEFLLRAFQSRGVQHQLHVEANGVTRYGLSHAAIKSVWLPIPPLAEQAGIVRFLNDQTAALATTVGRMRREIDLLRELRTRLIADVVTGQLDVRAAAAALPDEPTDDEPLDDADETPDEDDPDTTDPPEEDDA